MATSNGASKHGGATSAKSVNDEKSPTESAKHQISECTLVYIVIWCIHLLLPFIDILLFGQGHGGLDSRPLVKWDLFLLYPLVGTILYQVFLQRNTGFRVLELTLLAHALDLVIRIDRMPAVWDHEYWALLTNASFLFTFVPLLTMATLSAPSLSRAESTFLQLVRIQFALFYMAATFWKINSSFLNHNTSCGTVLILELLGAYTFVDGVIPESLAGFIAKAAPHLTLVLEGAMGLGMLHVGLLGINPCRNIMVALATAFHLSIFMLPVNSAGGFSLDCMTRFILFFDTPEIKEFVENQLKVPNLGWASLLSLGLIGLRFAATEAPFDVGFFAAGLVSTIYLALIINGVSRGVKTVAAGEYESLKVTLPMVSILAASATYAFVLPILGLQQMGAPTMYSNMRYYQGGNHYLVPTSVLGEDILFGGGLIQVVASTSKSLNMRLAYMPSDQVFPLRVVNLLEKTTSTKLGVYQLFPLCIFNPHSRDVLMADYDPSNPPGSELYTPVILPVSAVQQLLGEALENKEQFVAKFKVWSSAKSSNGDAVIVIDSSGSCYIEGFFSGSCQDDEIASMLLRPPTLLQRVVNKILTPYPQLVGMDEEICMS